MAKCAALLFLLSFLSFLLTTEYHVPSNLAEPWCQAPTWNEKGCSSTVKMDIFFLTSSTSWFSILRTNINGSTCVSYSCSKEPKGTQTLFLPALTREWGYYFLQTLAALTEFLSVEAHATGVQMEMLLRRRSLRPWLGCAAYGSFAHQHGQPPTSSQPLSCLSAAVVLPWDYQHASLSAYFGKKIPTFTLVQQWAGPNFVWSWISVTVWIFFWGPMDSLYTSVLYSTQCQSSMFFYNTESLSYYWGDYTACIDYGRLNGRMCWQEISFDRGDTACRLNNAVSDVYLTWTILLSGTNAPKYGMLSNHWTFLPFYYCGYTFLKLAEICCIVLWLSELLLHLPLGRQNQAEGSHAWSHHRTKRQKMSRTFFMYFVWPFKLFSWKHFLFFSWHAKWFEPLTYLTGTGGFSLLNADKAFKTPC